MFTSQNGLLDVQNEARISIKYTLDVRKLSNLKRINRATRFTFFVFLRVQTLRTTVAHGLKRLSTSFGTRVNPAATLETQLSVNMF